ncbi:pentapeptide repeat-containing protein [Lentzea guizhouensis]|uniref:pentapeptide repeat-containing protein n=1 Tax=Lentzea guizhouensis TaxID=1586287 RepID=UPI001F25AD3A|nr:pentapeptide repeat-containing protein [Lentzea guizhouensis]
MTTLAVLVFVLVLNTASSTERLDLIRTALAVGAGTGAVMTLVLAWRRQWATEHDAAERRLTELYMKAVEQLGSDKPAVRHGAMYALERVAQDNPDHRQTVVNVICAYLRAPFTPPPDKTGVRKPRGLSGSLRATPARRVAATAAAARRAATTPPPIAAVRDEDRRQEREVRLTAQRILTRHLRPGDPLRRPARSFWDDIDLDLKSALLIDFDLGGCKARTTRFDGATFNGNTYFRGATFWTTSFSDATFTGTTSFSDATFIKSAWLNGATFIDYAWFNGATFIGDVWFGDATFTGDVWFGDATFTGDVWFGDATFTGDVWFSGATFTGAARFSGATFTRNASFRDARFADPPVMSGASMRDQERPFHMDWPSGWTTHEVSVGGGGEEIRLVPVPVVLSAD